MNDYLTTVYRNLNEAEASLKNELGKISDAKLAIESILSPKSKKLTRVSRGMMGRTPLDQAMQTKTRIMDYIGSSNNGASVKSIQKNVKKPDGKPYAINSIRTYMSELTKMDQVQRMKGSRLYQLMK
jgi:hypothetical protein